MNRMAARDQTSYIRYLQEAASDSAIVALRSRALSQLQLKPGDHVVDLGCGPGTVTVPMGTAVGQTGRVVGVDVDPQMTAAADKAALQAGVEDFVSHRTGDCTKLAFESGVFDACYCERVFQHLHGDGPTRAAAEILRILKPSGRFIIIDTDWSTMSIETKQRDLALRVLQAWLQRFGNAASGSQLEKLAAAAGAVGVHAESTSVEMAADGSTAALVDAAANQLLIPSERLAWSRSLSESRRAKLPFGRFTMVTVFGTKNLAGHMSRKKAL
jgi:ubiquinone/menaquinone biosynthesis C-methylase UbiE